MFIYIYTHAHFPSISHTMKLLAFTIFHLYGAYLGWVSSFDPPHKLQNSKNQYVFPHVFKAYFYKYKSLICAGKFNDKLVI